MLISLATFISPPLLRFARHCRLRRLMHFDIAAPRCRAPAAPIIIFDD